MTQTLACLRCGRLMALEFYDSDGAPLPDDEGIQVMAEAAPSMLTIICEDCLTKPELISTTQAMIAQALNEIDETKAHVEWGLKHAEEGTKNQTFFKEKLAKLLQQEETMNANLAFLMAHEDDDNDDD
jgi:hypothetical protein